MSTLAQLKTRILSYLIDTTGASFSDATVTEAIRQALDEYTRYLPLTKDTVISLPGDGPEVALNGLDEIIDVLAMHYPYDTLSVVQPQNCIQGWYQWFDDAQPMATVGCLTPLVSGTEMRVKYSTRHSIEGLDSAALTSIHALHESSFVRGCAGFAAVSRNIDKVEQRQYGQGSKEPDQLRQWAMEQITSFQRDLDRFSRYGIPEGRQPRWAMKDEG